MVADEDGFLYFIGRTDDMIKTSGYRVSPTEIEEIAFATNLIAEAAALGVSDERLGQRIVLVAKAKGAERDTDAVIQAFVRQAPGYMVPNEIVWLDELPRNPNGKIDRNVLLSELFTYAEQQRA